MSITLNEMVEEQAGYRTESFSGSYTRNLNDIIRHEISMGNIDIILYAQHHYNILSDYVLSDEEIEELKSEYSDEKEYKEAYFQSFSFMCQENAPFITEEILEYVAQQLSIPNEVNGLWLSTYENVINIYNNGLTSNIDKYPIAKKNYIILSDLDKDGALFVFKEAS